MIRGRLGIPTVAIAPPLEAQVPSTGAWASLTSQHRCHVAARFLLAYADCTLIGVAFSKARVKHINSQGAS